MNHDDTAAAGDESLEVNAIRRRDVAGVGRVEHEDVGRGELLGGGESISTGSDGAAGVEQRRPLGEEARMVVGAGAVGFRARTDKDPERGGGEGGGGQRE